MNYFMFNYVNKDGENKELRLRLTSGDAIEIENAKKKSILDIVGDETLTSMITILRYLNKWENKNFSFQDAQRLYDELIDSGFSMRSILMDIIYEALVVSGFLEKDRWEEMKTLYQKTQEKTKKVLQETI